MINYVPVVQSLGVKHGVTVDVLRLDLLHEQVSGNKWFKLKFNISDAIKGGYKGILTFGGAHSNHIAATAAACRMSGLQSMAFIRGERPRELSPTLTFASEHGMSLAYLSRETYREQSAPAYSDSMQALYPGYWIVPEGGANKQGISGCAGILTPQLNHDFIFCGCGTAATYTGLVLGSEAHQAVIGINILKGNNGLVHEVNKNLGELGSAKHVMGNEGINSVKPVHFMTDKFAFKGYATYNEELVNFKKRFEALYKIPLDHVYTVKTFYGAFELINEGRLAQGKHALVIHTGGLQGNEAFEKRYGSLMNNTESGPNAENPL